MVFALLEREFVVTVSIEDSLTVPSVLPGLIQVFFIERELGHFDLGHVL